MSSDNNNSNTQPEQWSHFQEYIILYSTQTGRAKACARRCHRILSNFFFHSSNGIKINPIRNFDEYGVDTLLSLGESTKNILMIAFVSTTGDGEHCDAIQNTWKFLLNKNLPIPLYPPTIKLALFCLGDRRYGDLFCAAGRKFGNRMLQLGMKIYCKVGYADDDNDTFLDFDDWLKGVFFPALGVKEEEGKDEVVGVGLELEAVDDEEEDFRDYYCQYAPATAYTYPITTGEEGINKTHPLLGTITENLRLTKDTWQQDVHHITIDISSVKKQEYYYKAGDIAVIYPQTPTDSVDTFLSQLSPTLQFQSHVKFRTDPSSTTTTYPKAFTPYTYLQHCADLHAPPEREDLRLLSHYSTDPDHKEKLVQMSESVGNALYVDYIIRQRRNWIDVFHDFTLDRFENWGEVLGMLPQIRPRHFSLASSPLEVYPKFRMEVCVAVLEETTSLHRHFYGLCSNYLSRCGVGEEIRLWVRPGSFHKLPLEIQEDRDVFTTSLLCIGAGTGIAPLRGLIREREFLRQRYQHQHNSSKDTILLFGCRHETQDYIYANEWNAFSQLQVYTAFSRDSPPVKVYVQSIVQQKAQSLILHHLMHDRGAIYIAGNVKMCKAVQDEIMECLTHHFDSAGEEGMNAQKFLKYWKKIGLFAVEAWT